MRVLTTILLLLIGSVVFAIGPRTFYVSNAGNNANNGQSTTTSWQTLAQVNAAVFNSGDTVLFNRGDVFYGTLTNATSGVTYADYGSGAKPIITGFVSIASWTNLGSNIYEALVPNTFGSVNMVVGPTGQTIPMGRFPNLGTANGGYLTFESSDTLNRKYIDNQLVNTPNWTGADMVIRKRDFVIVRNPILNHTNTALTTNTKGQFDMTNGYGYFIENDLKTLDQNGEWYYDSVATKIKMYYTSTPPTIQVATVGTLINFPNANKSNITIKNISLKGSEVDLMYISYCSNVLIDSVDFTYAGATGLRNRDMINFTLQNCTFTDCNMTGIYDVNPGDNTSNNVLIKNNNFKRIGIWQGMIVKNNLNYHEGVSHSAISFGSQNMTIRENIIDSSGYCAIIVPKNRNYQVVRKNVVSNYNFLKNDGGGIYNSGTRTDTVQAIPFIIDSNIVYNSGDASFGTTILNDPHTRGIYLDASSTNVQILNNTVYNSYEGIYISQAQKIVIRGNTIYGGGKYAISQTAGASRFAGALNINNSLTADGYQHTINNTITRNTFFSDSDNKPFWYQADRANEVGSVGVVDSNMYVSPMNDFPLYLINVSNSTAPINYGFKTKRQAYTMYDANSTFHSTVIAPFTGTYTSTNKSPNSAFTSDINNTTVITSDTSHIFSWDNTSVLTGAGSAKIVNTKTSANVTQLRQIFGIVDATKKYVLRFKTKATKLTTYEFYLQEWEGGYNIMNGTKQQGFVDTILQQHEFLITGQTTTLASTALYINLSQNSQTVYVDDIELYEATSTPNVMSDYVKFSVNPTGSPMTVSLGGNSYTTLNNTSINTVTTIPPYSSSILFKGAVYVAPVYNNAIKLRFKFKRG